MDLQVVRDRIQKKEEERRQKSESMRTRILEAIETGSSEFVSQFPEVTELVIFGSLMRPGYFIPISDVDIAVKGLPNTRYWEALIWWSKRLEFDNIDLVRVEDARPAILKYIRMGKKIYGK